MSIDWNGDAFLRAIQQASQAKLSAAAGYLAGRLKDKVGRPNPTGRNPSLPGEPPKRVTGTLQTSITVEVLDELHIRILCVGYGAYLELGTRVMQPRPWIAPTIRDEIGNVQDVIGGEVGPLVGGLFD